MTLLVGVVAQLVEHHNGIVGVTGSNPAGSTILFRSRVFPVEIENPLARTEPFS